MAAVPQLPMFYDQLPLLLVHGSRKQTLAAVLLSHIGGLLWLSHQTPGQHPSVTALPWVAGFVFFPALIAAYARRAMV